jgi:hypothetical protein
VASKAIGLPNVDYVGNRMDMEDSKSVPVGSPVEQNEPPVLIGSHEQANQQ